MDHPGGAARGASLRAAASWPAGPDRAGALPPWTARVAVGALEARRWAGVVVALGRDAGVGLRLIFTTPQGERRDLEDWYWLAAHVGPHAPDGSYARMEFDLGVEPSPDSRPSRTSPDALVLEWSRRGDAVAVRAATEAEGRLELARDRPWRWPADWRRSGDGWETTAAGVEVGVAMTTRRPVRAVAAWGADARRRAGDLLPEVDGWIDGAAAAWDGGDEDSSSPDRDLPAEGSSVWNRDPPDGTSPAIADELTRSIADNLMWMVLLQPETGRLYTPAGRRWIFPRPRTESPEPSLQPAVSDDAIAFPGPSPGHPRPTSTDDRLRPDDWTVFGWDSFFNALLLAVASPDLAWETLLAGLDSRYPNGNVPNWRSRRGGTPDRSQPPVGAFAALQLHLAHPRAGALAAAWPGLLAWCDWWVANKNGRPRREGLTPGLLSWGSDSALVPAREQLPEWEAGAGGHQRAAWESGQDDLPLWEEADWDPAHEVLAMSAVDLCSYRALDLECMERIARILGHADVARRMRAERTRLVETMNRVLWCEKSGMYLDELPSGPSPRMAASNFLPLAAGAPSRRRAERMAAVLRDRRRFWGDWVLPTVPRDDPAFGDQQYWRGSIWPPMNYLVLQGLRRYGFADLARELAWKGARMFLDDRARTGFCRENFDARTGRGRGRRFQSWGPLFALGALEELAADEREPD